VSACKCLISIREVTVVYPMHYLQVNYSIVYTSGIAWSADVFAYFTIYNKSKQCDDGMLLK